MQYFLIEAFFAFLVMSIVCIISDMRSKKGKRSVVLILTVMALQFLFHFIMIEGEIHFGREKELMSDATLSVIEPIIYFWEIYITNKRAEKVKREKEENIKQIDNQNLLEIRERLDQIEQQLNEKNQNTAADETHNS